MINPLEANSYPFYNIGVTLAQAHPDQSNCGKLNGKSKTQITNNQIEVVFYMKINFYYRLEATWQFYFSQSSLISDSW